MAGFQFAHVETYARVGSVQKVKETVKVIDPDTGKVVKKETGKVTEQKTKSMVDIAAEAERVAGNMPHIDNPEAPELLYGVMPSEVIPMAEQWALQATDAQGRKLRKDGACLLAGVFSLPREREQEFPEFSKACIEYLKEKYGDRLKSVIAHDDEDHPHLHWYVVPKFGEKFEDIHEGVKAAKKAKAEGKKKGEQNQAYKQAMRGFQDDFYMKVAVRFALARLGPGRRRLPQAVWRAEEAQNEAIAKALAEAAAQQESAKEKAARIIAGAMERAKQIYEEASQKGYQRGKQKAVQEPVEVGAKFGAFLRSVMGVFHQPTSEALKAQKEAQDRAERERKAREKAEAEAKKEADKRVTKIAQELQQTKSKNIGLADELTNLTEANEGLAAVVSWYEKQYGPAPNDIKPK